MQLASECSNEKRASGRSRWTSVKALVATVFRAQVRPRKLPQDRQNFIGEINNGGGGVGMRQETSNEARSSGIQREHTQQSSGNVEKKREAFDCKKEVCELKRTNQRADEPLLWRWKQLKESDGTRKIQKKKALRSSHYNNSHGMCKIIRATKMSDYMEDRALPRLFFPSSLSAMIMTVGEDSKRRHKTLDSVPEHEELRLTSEKKIMRFGAGGGGGGGGDVSSHCTKIASCVSARRYEQMRKPQQQITINSKDFSAQNSRAELFAVKNNEEEQNKETAATNRVAVDEARLRLVKTLCRKGAEIKRKHEFNKTDFDKNG